MRPFFPTRFAEMLFALIMGWFGVMHLMNADTMSAGVPDIFPGEGRMWIYITGAGFIGAALAILFNKLKMPACYLLAAMLLVFVLTIHLKPAMDGNPGQLLKDTAIAMAAIIIGNRSSRT